VKKTIVNRGMTQHDLTVLSKIRTRKTLRKDIDKHDMGPKRSESHKTSSIKLAAKMKADVNVTRRFPANRIGRIE
jgi:hypothetical protein